MSTVVCVQSDTPVHVSRERESERGQATVYKEKARDLRKLSKDFKASRAISVE